MSQPTLFDPCARKHGGNVESQAAWVKASGHLGESQAEVLRIVREAGEQGATSKEVAAALSRELNTISGRFSELVRAGKIYRTTDRRDGAAVWRTV